MLNELTIKDFAIIDNLTIEFSDGLNVFTGETGAGKSIIVDAVNLVLGDRASMEHIRSSSDEARVEAEFDMPTNKSVRKSVGLILEDAGLPIDESVIVRRVMNRAGRNKIYINGSMTNLTPLSKIGTSLIDVYGQSEHQSLTKTEEHIEFLDSFGGLYNLRADMRDVYNKYRELKIEKDELLENIKRASEDRELLEYQSSEIGEANLEIGLDDKLEKEEGLLNNAEKIIAVTGSAEGEIYSSERAIVERLGSIVRELTDIAKFDKSVEPTIKSVETAIVELQEASDFLRDYGSNVEANPTRLEEVNEKLALIQKFKMKYGKTVEEILEKKEAIDRALESVHNFEDRLKEIDCDLKKSILEAEKVANKLHKDRVKFSKDFKSKIEAELETLGMNGAKFEITVNLNKDSDGVLNLNTRGADSVEFMISPNTGEELKPMAKIASGGELSRIMLGMKSITSEGRVPTLIFDEVDTGVGGAMSHVIGKKLKGISNSHQVICITHLPQVAAYGDTHYHVSKTTKDGRTVTKVEKLGYNERVESLARMLGGETITDTSRKHAQDLLKEAGVQA